MWLLSTDRAELHWFHDPEGVPGGYAILSHVWEGQEQTFKEIQDLRAKCAKSDQNPRDFASPKVRACCTLAERHGYKWIWDDTCCINKESSAELSEAINSMFRYYSLAKICYAYLYDVPRAEDLRPLLEGADSAFRQSRWHTRGWTLQELIAPPFLVFLSNDWEMLGTKMELAELLEEITKVPVAVLRLAQAVHDFSVACRMSWAANRDTTRAEDMAYCLMGIFSINMPTLYGEGERAFLRLQEEIMKQSVDASLFVWEDPDSMDQNTFTRREPYSKRPKDSCDHTIARYFLLAESPKAFFRSTAVSFSPTLVDETQQTPKAGTPSFSITPYGIRAHVPVIEGPDFSVAMLRCLEGKKKQTIGLILTPCYSSLDQTRPLYHTAWRQRMWRTVLLGESFANPHLFGQRVSPQWRDIYIADRPPPAPATILCTPSDYTLSPPFRFPMENLETCLGDYGSLVEVSQQRFGWAGSPPVVFKFQHRFIYATIYVSFGRCSSGSSQSRRGDCSPSALQPGPHWAFVLFDARNGQSSAADMAPQHVCAKDHIADWPGRSRLFTGKFENGDILLTLSFLEDALSPAKTLVPHVKHEVQIRSMNGPGVIAWRSDSDHI
ncbi:HET-domain-containing protein [Ganoderma leucocontextum]|nr:HET-domain-containing protein [Ganoderma leucocontextum]